MLSQRLRRVLLLGSLLLAASRLFSQTQPPGGNAVLLDNFSQDSSLNPVLWSTDTPLLKTIAGNISFIIPTAWVEPKISFSSSGMTLSGVSGTYQFTGIQSNRSFIPPFTVQAAVEGTIANGNPFELHLISGDLGEHLSVVGNVNKRNFGYYGMWSSCNGPIMDLFTHVILYASPDINVWYTVTISVGSTGTANVTLTDSRGTALGSRNGMNLGTGPFFLVLAQYEGLPNSGAGPNSATWADVQVSQSACADGLANSQTSRLIWHDEFDGPAGTLPNSTNWTYDVPSGGRGSVDQATYTSTSENVYQDGQGHLVIRAERGSDGTYTSAQLKTEGLFDVQYGVVEACIQLPFGNGLWPAFWMLGSNVQDISHPNGVKWPGSGEIDIVESSAALGPSTIQSSVHTTGCTGPCEGRKYTLPNGQTVSAGFHTYGVIWSPNLVQYFVDDPYSPFARFTPQTLPLGAQWALNHPFFVLLDLAVGSPGSWAGAPGNNTQFPASMTVDWVRAYKSGSLSDGPIPSSKSQSNPSPDTIPTPGVSVSPSIQRPTAAGVQSDQTIVSNINAKLWQDSVLKTLDIRVTGQNGVVTLTGTVNTQLEKAAVERIARTEKGVVQVIDQLAAWSSRR